MPRTKLPARPVAQPLKGKPSSLKMHGSQGGDGSRIELDESQSEWLRPKTLQRPEDQLLLTEEELNEEIARVLTTKIAQDGENLVIWSHKDAAFIPYVPPFSGAILLDIPSTCLHVDSQEAKEQMAYVGSVTIAETMTAAAPKVVKKETRRGTGGGEDSEEEEDGDVERGEERGAGEGDVDDEKEDDAEEEETEEPAMAAEDEAETGDELEQLLEGQDGLDLMPQAAYSRPAKKVSNQFNFCDRAALTYNNPFRNLSTQTEPPPRNTFKEQVMQWIIYDAYQADWEAKQAGKEKETKQVPKQFGRQAERKIDERLNPDSFINRQLRAAKTVERMLNQNTYDDVAKDCRYYEDPSDEYRDHEGTLLPLWKFSFEPTRKFHVTNICWNPRYHDLFAVTLGYFEFMKQTASGAVCLFTMKNPSYPEYVLYTTSSVMTAEFHHEQVNLLAVGLYDGSVAVYDLQQQRHDPVFRSDSVYNKHLDLVWQVTWGRDTPDGELNLYSVSNDGYVYNWLLGSNTLHQTAVISLVLETAPMAGPDGSLFTITGCGTALAFHPTNPKTFLVGTEEGAVFKCSTEYTSMFLLTYHAHHMPVHRIQYNHYLQDIFITCSADWRIKIWEDGRIEPLFVFDLHCSVGDVQWAPYSSTVFAAVTLDGRVHVFDLNVTRYQPICVQSVVSRKKNRLTRLAFNRKHPIIVVGDERQDDLIKNYRIDILDGVYLKYATQGTVTSLKLSPNLRVRPKYTKKQAHLSSYELEVQKMEKLLALVREPSELKRPADIEQQQD